MQRDNQLVAGGGLLFLLGVLAFVPPLLDRQLLILAWLGSMSQPIGLSAMIVGGVLWSLGRLQQFRNAPPPGIVAPDAPSETGGDPSKSSSQAPAAAAGPSPSTSTETR